ncbi:MAG: glycoside hydrolase family 3 C-terminal domain-containing protein [Bacillota bacterium]|nr:glycoside hydrolase family 3 C-terminal domain-containing protein [Bacillota bacterium]
MEKQYRFQQPDQPLEVRIDDLISLLTLEEKVSQMLYASSAIGRLGIYEYNWWNEALHGVARAGVATVFPQAIGMAAAFNRQLLHEVAAAIAAEGRAKYNAARRHEDRGMYKGITFWSPNINIFRDPRWGRGQETYGEDPYLTGRLAVAFITGLQGDDPKYLKAAACAKHYAVHSGPELKRHEFNAQVSPKDLRETYLPAFRDAVKEAKVEAVMGAYNRVNGEPACGSYELLIKILREEWGFEGHVVSDCGAIRDFYTDHKVVETPAQAAALAVNNGCDLNCGRVFEHLLDAVNQGLLSEEAVDRAVKRLLRARFKLGMFDPEELVPFNWIPYEVNDCAEHRLLAREMARESIVLMKNEGSLLPLDKAKVKNIAVIGPNADSRDVLIGNYFGTASKYVPLLAGIQQAVNDGTRVYYAQGCDLRSTKTSGWGRKPTSGFAEALTIAEMADVVIMAMGISPKMEGEQGASADSDGGGDRLSLDLPGMQEALLKAIHALGKPIVLVLFNGSPLTINWAQEHIPAIIEAWYPGQEGGNAIADVIFGDYNPSGRLPVTFVKSLDQLPDFEDYSMENRTYRFMNSTPLYPFGYGLSYTKFDYSGLALDQDAVDAGSDFAVKVSVSVTNSGDRAGAEVVMLYVKDEEASVRVPNWELQGFQKIMLQPGESQRVEFTLARRQLALIGNDGKCVLEPGRFTIYVGGQQPDARSQELTGRQVLKAGLVVTGSPVELEY